MVQPERGYVSVEGRRVLYRRMGSGPPLVMLHGSPGDGEVLAEEMAAAAAQFTCFALDTPGFGGSDPLEGNILTVPDLARATAAAMKALDLPPCRVYGTHTGAAIGLELGVGWRRQVTGLVLEGLPVFTEAEMTVLFDGYFTPMAPDPLGGHLTSTWVRFRDQFTWFPWRSRDVNRLNPVDRPSAAEIDMWVSMYYRSCKTYGPAYKAACYYGSAGLDAVRALSLPAVFMCSAEDMLFGHLDRLPPLRASQSIARLAYDPPAKMEAIVAFAAGLPGEGPAPEHGGAVMAGLDPAKGFIDAPDGQVFVRTYGDADRPTVILLHDAPGSGLALQDMARALASTAFVVVPDLPGVGESQAPPQTRPILEASAKAVGAVVDALGLERFTVAAIGCGCAAAAAFAETRVPGLAAVLIEDPPAPDEAAANAIAPDLPLTPEGAHWLKAWLMLRDNQIYQPWYDGSVAAQRRTQGNFDADWLHDQTVALMQSRETYHRFARAARRYDAVKALMDARAPLRIAQTGGLAALIQSTIQQNG
jgi:pimeloyl-ACP methyl ester carboxylesterase